MSLLSMANVVIDSLFKKPATHEYPFKPMVYAERVRGQIVNEIDKCIFCGICQKRCPTGAIKVAKAEPESLWAIERFRCVQCNCCVEVCPKKCLIMKNELTSASYDLTKDEMRYARVPADTKNNKDS